MLADDISIKANGKSIDETELGLNEDLGNIRLWLQANKLSHNVAKTEYMFIGSRQTLARLSFEPNLCIGRDPIKRIKYTKTLRVYVDDSLTWSKHVKEVSKNITPGISALKRLRYFASQDVLFQFIMH